MEYPQQIASNLRRPIYCSRSGDGRNPRPRAASVLRIELRSARRRVRKQPTVKDWTAGHCMQTPAREIHYPRSGRDTVDTLCRLPDYGYSLRNKRLQLLKPVPDCEHDNDWNRQAVRILFVCDHAIDDDQGVETAVRRKQEQGAVAGAGPTHLRDGLHLESVRIWRREPTGHGLVEQQPHPGCRQAASWPA